MKKVVVIGAGLGGLTVAAVLARAGLDVTVLEAQVNPGGCASTFYHQGYRFDSGATLAAGFYSGGPMDLVARAAGIESWPVTPADTAMLVHLPHGQKITRWTNDRRWNEYRAAFGEQSLEFFRWQEIAADALWNLALRLPPWPPQTIRDSFSMLGIGIPWLVDRGFTAFAQTPALALDAVRSLGTHLCPEQEELKLFVDAQLLISAQVTSEHANALYGAAALDLPRRGVAHLAGGMGVIAETLAQTVSRYGGHVLYRNEVTRINTKQGRPVSVETKHGDSFPADILFANLTPWNAADLLDGSLPASLRHLPPHPNGWGAFMVYVGLDGTIIPPDLPLHHQIVMRRPFGEGNTVFASLSPAWDSSRAPAGQRALTLSTHTTLNAWWQLFRQDKAAYSAHKLEYTESVLAAAEKVLPGLRSAARLVLSGTPTTFQRFTRRKQGWVGGFPQTNLFKTFGARLSPDLWLVGDSIFPGQSVAAAALGGLRVAHLALDNL